MKKFSFMIICILLAAQSIWAANSKTEADQAYQTNDYAKAITMYEEILNTQGESADIYYNLGNSYYKTDDIARAILNYERALLLAPGDADIRFNLEMVRTKTIDQITPTSEVFIVTWIKSLTNSRSESGWAATGIVSFLLMLACLILYIFGRKIVLKKIGFIGAIVLLIVIVSANVFASAQKEEITERTGAIIISPTVTVKSTPDESGTDLFVIHEGTKVFVEDNSMKSWKEIRLADGKKGWLPAQTIEKI